MQEPFGLIVCGIDGSPAALEGARQAGALAVPGTTIELVAVSYEGRASEALAAAEAELAGTPARVVARTVNGVSPARRLIEWAADADLLVVGRHSRSRLRGILIGSTASEVLHCADVPVMVAVPPPAGVEFPDRILVAAGGPHHPEELVALATSIAELHGSDITLLRVDWSHGAKQAPLAQAVATLHERTGREPVELIRGGSPHRVIPRTAGDEEVALVITGSRGLKGVSALRSVSERVAHASPCSVLVLHSANGK